MPPLQDGELHPASHARARRIAIFAAHGIFRLFYIFCRFLPNFLRTYSLCCCISYFFAGHYEWLSFGLWLSCVDFFILVSCGIGEQLPCVSRMVWNSKNKFIVEKFVFQFLYSRWLWYLHKVFYFLLNFGLTRWEERFESDYRRLYQLKVEQDRSWLKGKYVTAPHHVHEHSVRGVSFSPITPSVFASCGIYFYLFAFIIFTFFYSLLLGYDSTAHVYNVNSFPSPTHSYMPQALGGIINNWERYAQFLVLKLNLYWSILVFLELSGLVMEGI